MGVHPNAVSITGALCGMAAGVAYYEHLIFLGFLLMIGMTLIAESFGAHLPKGYIYAAMAFSAFVESLNMLARARRKGDGKRER